MRALVAREEEGTLPPLSVVGACQALGLARANYYRRQAAKPLPNVGTPPPCRVPGRALTPEQQQQVLEQLHSERFMDKAAPQVYATLLDEGVYLCSVATMYRLLRKHGEVHERRLLRSHPSLARPELLANGPNQVWSWDITKLKGPRKWTYFYLYVILDIYSRYVVGWCIAEKESAELAEALIQETLLRQQIAPAQLTIHADRGSAMTSKPVAALLIEMGVDKTHSRPHTSNDNPFSESHFKTMKFRPEVPERFASIEAARCLFRDLFVWYNNEHRHSGIGLLTPATVHAGAGTDALAARARVLEEAYQQHPTRFVNKPPMPKPLPSQVWINPPLAPSEASRDASGDSHASTA